MEEKINYSSKNLETKLGQHSIALPLYGEDHQNLFDVARFLSAAEVTHTDMSDSSQSTDQSVRLPH